MKKKKKEIIGYLCGTDWQHEAGDILSEVSIYNTIKQLKASKVQCWKNCGIVKVKIIEEEWVREQDLFRGKKKARGLNLKNEKDLEIDDLKSSLTIWRELAMQMSANVKKHQDRYHNLLKKYLKENK